MAGKKPSKHAGGRPSEMTPEIVAKMLEGIGLGLSVFDVADLAGKHRVTLYRWIEAAQKAVDDDTATPEQVEFCNQVKTAQQEGQMRRLKRIESGDAGWQGCAWIQERRFRQQWGASVQHVGDPTNPVTARVEVSYVDRPIERDTD